MPDKPFREMTDDELLTEHAYWDERVRLATTWGAAQAQAARWREACRDLLTERGVKVPE
jgi:hypothetical protein